MQSNQGTQLCPILIYQVVRIGLRSFPDFNQNRKALVLFEVNSLPPTSVLPFCQYRDKRLTFEKLS